MIATINKLLGSIASVLPPENQLRRAGAKAWDGILNRSKAMVQKKIHGEELWLSGRWRSLSENYEMEALDSFLDRVDDQVIWDIGAHIGIYTLLAAKRLKGAGRVYAWEPSPGNFSDLVRHIKKNKLEGRCTPFQAAVTDGVSAQVELLIDDSSQGGDTHRLAGERGSNTSLKICVPAGSMDRWVEETNVPGLIKIDVEGAEGMVLEGGRKLLSGTFGKRPLIFLSVHPHFLWEFGWKMQSLDPLVKDLGYKVTNLKGEPSALDKHAEFWLVPASGSVPKDVIS